MKTGMFLLLVGFFVFTTFSASAQIINPKKLLQKKAENRVNKAMDKAADQVLDSITGVKEEPKKDIQKDDSKKSTGDEIASSSGSTEQTALQSYSRYDFIPGDKILLFEDFSQDAVGDFPDLWTTDVAGEINTVNIAEGHWFNLKSTEGTYWLMKDIDIPKNFILEMDIIPKKAGGRFAADIVLFGESAHSEMDKEGDPGLCGIHVSIEKNIWETRGYKKGQAERLIGSSVNNLVEPEKVNHVILWVQNRRLRIYHKGGKVLDVPTNLYEGSKFSRLCFKLYRGASAGSYISNIKITTASPDMRNKLLTEGKLVSYGIYFDVNKDIVKPESYGSLKEIAAVLSENPGVKIKVIGHTDADGNDASNLDLSKRRGASVKNELVTSFGIDATRIETDGKGETQPIAVNDTPSNKALNRRVEFIKL